MPGALHGDLHAGGDLLDHRDVADLLGQERLAHREAGGEPQLLARRVVLGDVGGGEDRGVRADHAVGAARPDDRDALDLLGVGALGDQRLAERAVGDDPGVVVDAAVALGLADDREDAVGRDARPRRRAWSAPRRRRRSGSGPCGLRWRWACQLVPFGAGVSRGTTTVPASPATACGDLVEAGDDAACRRWSRRSGRPRRPWAPSSRTRSGPRRRGRAAARR